MPTEGCPVVAEMGEKIHHRQSSKSWNAFEHSGLSLILAPSRNYRNTNSIMIASKKKKFISQAGQSEGQSNGAWHAVHPASSFPERVIGYQATPHSKRLSPYSAQTQ